MTNPPVTVLLVDDSSVVRGFLRRALHDISDIKVVGSAGDGANALRLVRERPVDVVLLDVEMPEMNGLEALPRILDEAPDTRVIMVSSLTRKGAEVSVKALTLGAADCVAKPSSLTGPGGIDSLADELVPRIRALGRGGRPGSTPGSDAEPHADSDEPTTSTLGAPISLRPASQAPPSILCIASSTGGPQALQAVIEGLPDDDPLPVLVVQHMPPIFTEYLARRLDGVTSRNVAEATDGEPVLPGRVYVAPGDRHLVAEDGEDGPRLRLTRDPPVNFCRPAADPLFHSVARVWGKHALAVVLTGMGHDGMEGARSIVREGGTVMVQDEESSLVWGMPGAVARAGLAHAMVPLSRIASRVSRFGRVPA